MCLDHCVFQSNGLFSFLDKFTAIHSHIISFCRLFKILRDWVEREVGGGIGMGNICKSMANSCQCMTKNTTIL